MGRIIQAFLRIFGVFVVVFAILVSTETGERVALDNGIDIKNSSLRVLFNIDDSNPEEPVPIAENNTPIWGILDLRSFLFILMLMVGITLVSLDISQYKGLFRNTFIRSAPKIDAQVNDLVKRLKKMSDDFYRGGARALKEGTNLKKVPPVWGLIIDQLELKLPFYDIVRVMGNEAGIVRKRFDNEIRLVSTLSNIAPSLGVIGTVLGLVKLLFNLKDPTSLGPNMALALLTTLYGLLLSVLVFKPIMVRIENVKEAQMRSYQLAAFWLGILADRKPSFYMDQNYIDKKSKK